MAGKITFLYGLHPSSKGGWVEPASLSAADVVFIERLMGCALSQSSVARLEDLITTVGGMKRVPAMGSSQDIKETLTALTKLPDEAVNAAIKCADSGTRALVCNALLRMGESEPWRFSRFKPPKNKAAALLALHELPKWRGGARIKGYRKFFAARFSSFWIDILGEDPVIHSWDGGASPAVECAQFLLAKINDVLSLSATADVLRKVDL